MSVLAGRCAMFVRSIGVTSVRNTVSALPRHDSPAITWHQSNSHGRALTSFTEPFC